MTQTHHPAKPSRPSRRSTRPRGATRGCYGFLTPLVTASQSQLTSAWIWGDWPDQSPLAAKAFAGFSICLIEIQGRRLCAWTWIRMEYSRGQLCLSPQVFHSLRLAPAGVRRMLGGVQFHCPPLGHKPARPRRGHLPNLTNPLLTSGCQGE